MENVGLNALRITIDETDCGPADETPAILNIPVAGMVRRQICVLNSGTATTIDPILGTIPNPAGTIDVAVENETPAATVDTQGVATFVSPAGVLYHRSRPDAGADNAIQTVYHIGIGW